MTNLTRTPLETNILVAKHGWDTNCNRIALNKNLQPILQELAIEILNGKEISELLCKEYRQMLGYLINKLTN